MITHLLNRQLEVWRYSTVDDGMGGRTGTWWHAATVAARRSQPTATERQVAQQSGAHTTDVVYLQHDADVARGDELRDGGEVLAVLATLAPSKPAYLRADCQSRQRR